MHDAAVDHLCCLMSLVFVAAMYHTVMSYQEMSNIPSGRDELTAQARTNEISDVLRVQLPC